MKTTSLCCFIIDTNDMRRSLVGESLKICLIFDFTMEFMKVLARKNIRKKEEGLFQPQLRACRCISVTAMDFVRSNSAFIIAYVLEASYGVPFLNIS